MPELVVRTLSQSLQAFLPVAVALAWLGPRHRPVRVPCLWALVIAVPTSWLAGLLFRSTPYQARWESALATGAALIGVAAWRLLARVPGDERADTPNRNRRLSPRVWLMVCAVTLLVIVRQTMEIAAVLLVAVVELRSADALMAVALGLGAGAVGALFVYWSISQSDDRGARRAARAFAASFVALAAWYAIHEASEAGLLPFSEWVHAATEPYGPDGLYGRYFSAVLLAAPMVSWSPGRSAHRFLASLHPLMLWATSRRALASAAVLTVGGVAALTVASGALEQRGGVSAAALASVASSPHLLYRNTAEDADYGKLAITPLDPIGTTRVSAGLSCERVAWSSNRGVCLQAERRVFTSYRAILFDRTFGPLVSLKLDGSPSRTRVAPDGRVAAITVFLTGHGYASSGFSTKTTLIDAESGDELGELEQFSTWRDGVRFQEQDFNFWGVTFAEDSRTFYASLGTGGKTYLVKGDLALRRLTVIRENLECPSLSPDGRSIAFKKRAGPKPSDWRLHVLDLATMTDRPIAAETRAVDDQIEWLDNTHVLYGVPRPSSAVTDIWIAAIDTSTPARVFLPQADSPSVVRWPAGHQ